MMKRLSDAIERIFTAAAFAECGESETARLIMNGTGQADEYRSGLHAEEVCLP